MAEFALQADVDGDASKLPVLDFEVVAAVLASRCAGTLDVAVERHRGVEFSGRVSSRWEELLSALPRFLYEGVLGALKAQYGEETKHVLAQEWSQGWVRWQKLRQYVAEVLARDDNTESCFEQDVHLDFVRRVLRAHVRLFARHEHHGFPSDRTCLLELESLGLTRGRGEVFVSADGRSANQCLADSLLQLLIRNGFLLDTITIEERQAACAENRRRLCVGDDVARPRSRDAFTGEDQGEDHYAYLQHDVHAEITIRFFMAWFDGLGKKGRDLPACGVVLTVRSRFDSLVLPPDRLAFRVGEGGSDGGAVEFQLYNLTGEGFSGMHYDPLFPSAVSA
jgi:hypothetical protein